MRFIHRLIEWVAILGLSVAVSVIVLGGGQLIFLLTGSTALGLLTCVLMLAAFALLLEELS
jgi:hypothetical protein